MRAVHTRSLPTSFVNTIATDMISDNLEVMDATSETDGGWVPGRVGLLCRSPLAGGEGVCDVPYWERMVTNIQLSVEALKDNPTFSRSRQRHQKELEHAKHIVTTIKEAGFFDRRIHNASSQ